jgi:hypothetical protein
VVQWTVHGFCSRHSKQQYLTLWWACVNSKHGTGDGQKSLEVYGAYKTDRSKQPDNLFKYLLRTASEVYWSEFLAAYRRCIVFPVRYALNLRIHVM